MAMDDNMGTVYPPGALNVFELGVAFFFNLSFIAAMEIPSDIRSEVALEIMANCLNSPTNANTKHKMAYAIIATCGVMYLL